MNLSSVTLGIILPVYNAESTLGPSLDSVVNQAHNFPFQIYVVDDGSTDRSAEIAMSYDNVTYLRQDNAGPAAARNSALKTCSCTHIGFIDADDLWPDGKIGLQIEKMIAEDADINIGMTQFIWEGDDAKKENLPKFHDPDKKALIGPFLGSAIMKKSCFDRVGNFNETLKTGEDLDWFIRAKEAQLKTQVHSEITLRYRRHSGNMTRDLGETIARNNLRILRDSLKRRRESGETPDMLELFRVDSEEA